MYAVFAYGQTGSGKTYTMGSAFTPGGNTQGVIPKVMDSIFERITSNKDAEYTVRVGFVEIHKVSTCAHTLCNAHGCATPLMCCPKKYMPKIQAAWLLHLQHIQHHV